MAGQVTNLKLNTMFKFLKFKGIAAAVALFLCFSQSAYGDTGYELWLNYKPVTNQKLVRSYTDYCKKIRFAGSRYDKAISEELTLALDKMLGIPVSEAGGKDATLVMKKARRKKLGNEGYSIRSRKGRIVIEANGDAGLLYGTYHLIRLMQCGEPLDGVNITEVPKIDLRHLNHWDNLNGSIERGYAGRSLWKWDELPGTLDPRYKDYARANASIGINGTVLNNVNASSKILDRAYLEKIAALADILRDYNIKVYLSANFAAPMRVSSTPNDAKRGGGVGQLDTADPFDPEVQRWWKAKADEIYELIPDFGGFLVKANSEGMPGPQDYKRTHADGANMLAKALEPHGGIVMWRTFVYNDTSVDPDRVKRAYKEFKPLDGLFADNVILQTKNGPLDFHPSEPVLPLFGGMRNTPLQPELQITQEYLGQSTYLVYLVPMWRKFFDFDTFCEGRGSTVAGIAEGKVYKQKFTAIAGVANTGDDENWTGHHFAQANWYAFGRLAWNPGADTRRITREWIGSTWTTDEKAIETIEKMMMPAWESFVASQSPYGLGFTTRSQDHFTAGFASRVNKEWKVNGTGIGSDRTTAGTDYVSQYFEPNRSMFNDINSCPELLLLTFHFAPWDHIMKSGVTLKTAFFTGLTKTMQLNARNKGLWFRVKDAIDPERYEDVVKSLDKEAKEAREFYESADSFFKAAVKQ